MENRYYIEDQRKNDMFMTVLFAGQPEPSRREAIIEAIRLYEYMCKEDRKHSESYVLLYGPLNEEGEPFDEEGMFQDPIDVIVDLAGSTDEERELLPNLNTVCMLMDDDLFDEAYLQVQREKHRLPVGKGLLHFITVYCTKHRERYGVDFCRDEAGIWSY